MTALEFAIANTFRHFFFGLRLALLWAILLVPVVIAVWFGAFGATLPDVKALTPKAIAGLAVLGAALLLASFSIAVNWHRRIILGESPKGFGWVRLNGVVWKYLLGFVLVWLIAGAVAAASAASAMLLPAALADKFGAAAKPVAFGLSALLGLAALMCGYRLSTWLPAIATGDKEYTLGRAWRVTRKNNWAFLGFTFWLVFTLAIAGALGAGAIFAQQKLVNSYATAAAFGFAGLLGWLCLFLITTVATAHYACFAGRDVFPKNGG